MHAPTVAGCVTVAVLRQPLRQATHLLRLRCAVPAVLPLQVGSTDEYDDHCWFSNHDPRTVHISAPGNMCAACW